MVIASQMYVDHILTIHFIFGKNRSLIINFSLHLQAVCHFTYGFNSKKLCAWADLYNNAARPKSHRRQHFKLQPSALCVIKLFSKIFMNKLHHVIVQSGWQIKTTADMVVQTTRRTSDRVRFTIPFYK